MNTIPLMHQWLVHFINHSPDEEAYVQVGDKVTNESTVCILEAMKLFNEIQAETTGEIIEILVEDGQMVEYGQPLFKWNNEKDFNR